jgi:signal transduction histidine kinase
MSRISEAPAALTAPHHRVPRWVPDAVFTAFVLGMAFSPPPIDGYVPTSALVVALTLLPIAVLPWRRVLPLTVLGALIALFGVVAALGTLSFGIGFAVAVAMFHVASMSEQQRTSVVGAVVALLMILLSFLVHFESVFDPRVLQFGLLAAFATAAGAGKRIQEEYVAAITERAERAEQTREIEAERRVSEERLRIARDLHDAVAHQISVISLNANVASSAVDTRPARAKEALATIRTAARTVLGEIGDLLGVLRAHDRPGEHGPRPMQSLDDLDRLIDQFAGSGLAVTVRSEGPRSRLPATVSLVAYRIVQEALTNAHKHGAAGRAHVLLHEDAEQLSIVVTNPMRPGSERAAEESPPSNGLGLVGLRERVASVRGSIEAGPTAGGYRLHAGLPLHRERERTP